MLLVGHINKNKIKNKSQNNNNVQGFDKLNYINSKIPAVTHVDNSARIQTVNKETNPDYYNLLNEFYNLTSCPVLINTSFNVRGEPIVESPEDAYRCFMRTEMDYLVIESFILNKEDQDKFIETKDWKTEFELD